MKVEFTTDEWIEDAPTATNNELVVWCRFNVVDTNMMAIALQESQNMLRCQEGLILAGLTTGKKADIPGVRLFESEDCFRLWGITNVLYGCTCENSFAKTTLLSDTVYMIGVEMKTLSNTATNICERILNDYEKKYFPNRFICTRSDIDESRWLMPFFKANKLKEGYCQNIMVRLSGSLCGVRVYDDVGVQLKQEAKIYKAQKREKELIRESKQFKVEDLFGVGLGWYQIEEEKLDAKNVQTSNEYDTEFFNECLKPTDYKRYFGLGLTGYGVRKRSRRVWSLCAENSAPMSKEVAKRTCIEINADLSKRIGVEGVCTIKNNGWVWNWDWRDADGHAMQVMLPAVDLGNDAYELLMFVSDFHLRDIDRQEEFTCPSGIRLGVYGALKNLGCAVATEPRRTENGRSYYDVLSIRKGLYLAELPMSSVAIDTNGCAVAVSYSVTNEMSDAEIQNSLKTIRRFVENSLQSIGTLEHAKFGALEGVTSYYWVIDAVKPKGDVCVFLHGGRSMACPPLGLDIYWLGKTHPEQFASREKKHQSDLFASTCRTIVFISGKKTAGSGFIVREGGKCYVYTNRHVVDNGDVVVKDIQDNALKVIGREDAIGLDVSRLEIQELRTGLEFSLSIPNIGDDITVIGDSDGVGAATKLEGRVIAVGPKVLELDAKFIPGNSGSPVLRSDGKVIGIATFGYDGYSPSNRFKSGTRFNGLRRFALRIPEEVKWRTVW